jgi:hypothetical protein
MMKIGDETEGEKEKVVGCEGQDKLFNLGRRKIKEAVFLTGELREHKGCWMERWIISKNRIIG